MNEMLAWRIQEMRRIDQELRFLAKESGDRRDNLLVYALDAAHNYWLRKTINEFGHPTKALIGEEALFSFWLLVQHQCLDPKLQEECLKYCDFNSSEQEHLRKAIRHAKGRINGNPRESPGEGNA